MSINSPFPEKFQSSRKIPGMIKFRNFAVKKLSEKYIIYIAISKKQPNSGDSRIPECLDSRF